MADHAPVEVAGDDPLTALYRKLEYFPTPPWAARAGGELIKRLDPEGETCWEPACGQGHMHAGLADYFARVFGTDIHDHRSYRQEAVLDFLDAEADAFQARNRMPVDWIVTNPPFKPAADFVRVGLRRARRGVAIFARSGWLETIGRYGLFFGDETPLTVEAPFFERVPLQLGGWDPDGSTATPYSWFLFFRPEALPAPVAALRQALSPCSITLPIPPGTERRLTRPDDARLFGRLKAMPLFEGP